MSCKKLVLSFSITNGSAHGAGDYRTDDPRDICAQYYGAADAFAACLPEQSEQEKDRSLDVLRDFCRASSVPVIGCGPFKRLEDVKKLIYAGCSMVAFGLPGAAAGGQEADPDLIRESTVRFGEDHIAPLMAEGCGDPGTNAGLLRQEDLAGLLFEAGSLTREELLDMRGKLVKEGISLQDRRAAFSWDDFKKGTDGLLPVVVQEDSTDQVLMVAYMNEEAYRMTVETGRMTYYSRSRRSLWIKGETSGHFQYVKSLHGDCDMDTLLARVEQFGAACHTGSHSCFFEPVIRSEKEGAALRPEDVLRKDYETILERRDHPVSGSYTNYLFEKGIDKMLKKLGEESTEIVIAAKNHNPNELVYEIADYLYHMMVVMAEKGLTWDDISAELIRRQK